MPTITLTEQQTKAVQPILDEQADRKTGCLAVVNFGFSRITGERTVELSFTSLPFAQAVKICRSIKKLTNQPSSQP